MLNQDSFGPAASASAITPSDTTVFEQESIPKALYVGGSGNLRVLFVNDTSPVTIVGAVAGSIYPFRVKRVYSTLTTATNIVGLF